MRKKVSSLPLPSGNEEPKRKDKSGYIVGLAVVMLIIAVIFM
jgi:hypothetical protein